MEKETWRKEVMKAAQKDKDSQFVTRKEFEELHEKVSRYQDYVIKSMEDRLVFIEELVAIKNQLNGRPVEAAGET
jgi:hypothetical protein